MAMPAGCGRVGAVRARLVRRSPRFARLLAAEVVSPVGDAMATVALVLHLQRGQGTGTAVATVMVAEALPPLLAPWLGALSDRAASRRSALLAGCAVAQAAMLLVIAATLPPVAPLFGLVLLRAMFGAIAAPAMGAAVPDLVDDDDLPAANSLVGGGREIGSIIGPALAGALFVPLGAAGVLVVDALSFLAIVPLVASLGAPAQAEAATTAAPDPSTVRADALEGLRHLWHTPVLRAIALGFWLMVLASASDDLFLVFLGADDLRASPTAVGILLSAASIGLMIGLVTTVRWTRGRVAPITAVIAGFALVSTGNLLTAAAPAIAVAFLTQVVRGSGIALIDTNVRTHVQRTTPRRLLGRTLANLYGGVSVAAAAGYVIGGPLLDATSARTMFVVIGTAGFVATAASALLVRRARRRDEGAPEGPLDATAG
jgi:MFS family permease